MNRPFLLALVVSLALPTWAQDAPAGWKTQIKVGGATTFTPPDLKTGEKFSVTLYDAAPLGGKSLEAFLRAFAGPVGTRPGQLSAPLQVAGSSVQRVALAGIYNGPDGGSLGVLFLGLVVEGNRLRVARSLYSSDEVLVRYQKANTVLVEAIARGAGQNPAENQVPPAPADLPDSLPDMKVGGALVPGIYGGPHQDAPTMGLRSSRDLRIHIYPNGEYRICNDRDEELSPGSTGQIKYDHARGTLDIDAFLALSNDKQNPNQAFCYYGRDSGGKPLIYGQSATTGATILFLRGPLTNRKSPSEEEAPARLAKAARDAIQTRVAPGQGVPDAQIVAVVHHHEAGTYIPGVRLGGPYAIQLPDQRTDATDEAYLLLRDGTIYKGLQWAPDQFDIAASRRKEPELWGKWKRVGDKIQMSFGGAYEPLPGKQVRPATPQTRLNGRYKVADSSFKNPITFSSEGRFKRETVDPNNPYRAPFMLAKARKTVAGGDLSGTYTVNGYTLTLRYDNGAVERTPFFFIDKERGLPWFEGHLMVADRAK